MASVKVVPGEGRFAKEVGAFVRTLGLEYYAYMAVKLPKGVTCAPEDTLRSNYPDAWVRRYLERGYRFYDPVVVSGAASRVPFRWGHGGFLNRYTKAQRLVFHEAREFDITEGYCVPVTGPAGDIGLFSVAAASRAELEDVVEESAPAIQLFVVQLFDEVMRGLLGGGRERRASALESRTRMPVVDQRRHDHRTRRRAGEALGIGGELSPGQRQPQTRRLQQAPRRDHRAARAAALSSPT